MFNDWLNNYLKLLLAISNAATTRSYYYCYDYYR